MYGTWLVNRRVVQEVPGYFEEFKIVPSRAPDFVRHNHPCLPLGEMTTEFESKDELLYLAEQACPMTVVLIANR